MFECKLCQQVRLKFPNIDELEAHLASEHFELLPYECENCHFAKFPTEFAVMKHCEKDHNFNVYSFRCRITPDVLIKRRNVQEMLHNMQPNHSDISGTNSGYGSYLLGISPNDSESKKQRGNQINKPDEALNLADKTPPRYDVFAAHAAVMSFRRSNQQIYAGEQLRTPQTTLDTHRGKSKKNVQTESDNQTSTQLKAESSEEIMGDIYYDDQMNIDDLNGSESDLKHDPDQLDSTSKWISFFTSNGDTSDGCRDLTPGSSEFSRNDDISAAESDGTGDHRYSLQENGNRPKHYRSFDPVNVHLNSEKKRSVERIQCRKCNELVNITGGCLMHHINTRHLKLPLFHCKKCQKDFLEVSNTAIHKHMRLHHGGDTSGLQSNYHTYKAQLHKARDEWFGKKEERLNKNQKGGESMSQDIKAVQIYTQAPPFSNIKEEEHRSNTNTLTPSATAHFLINDTNFETTVTNEEKVICRQCGEMVWNKVANRLNHINVKHLHIPLYSCRLCGKQFQSFSRSACFSHVSFCHKQEMEGGLHGTVDENIVNLKDEYMQQLQDVSIDYF